jgi:hypothetical protein
VRAFRSRDSFDPKHSKSKRDELRRAKGAECVLCARTLHYKITHLTIKIKGEAFDLFTLGTVAAASLFFPLFSPGIIPFHLHDNARGGFEKFRHC